MSVTVEDDEGHVLGFAVLDAARIKGKRDGFEGEKERKEIELRPRTLHSSSVRPKMRARTGRVGSRPVIPPTSTRTRPRTPFSYQRSTAPTRFGRVSIFA